jgi:hypothetical protein
MLKNAIEKIKAEMEQKKNDAYTQVVGEFLLGHLGNHPKDAEKIISADKTIAKSLDEIRKAAEKKKVGNFATLTPQEGYAIVLKYFQIESTADVTVPVAVTHTQTIKKTTPQQKSKVDFDISLDDFI